MKKILAGMFFRLFKGCEVWVLLALMVICSLYFNYASMNSEQFLYIYHSEYTEEVSSHRGEVTVNVNKDNVEQFRFENFNVTTEEAYKYLVEPIAQLVGCLPDDEAFYLGLVTVQHLDHLARRHGDRLKTIADPRIQVDFFCFCCHGIVSPQG